MALRIALFGQAAFGRDVLVRLLDAGHASSASTCRPTRGAPIRSRPRPRRAGSRCSATRRFRRAGVALPERVAEHRALGAELNVLAFVTTILPPEIVDAPRHRLALLPPFAAAALPRRLGARLADHPRRARDRRHGVPARRRRRHRADRGPEGRRRDPRHRHAPAASTSSKLYPLGIEAIARGGRRGGGGHARAGVPQDEARATAQGLVTDAVARIDWTRDAARARPPDPRLRSAARRLRAAARARRCGSSTDACCPARADAPPGSVLGLEDGRLRARGARRAARGRPAAARRGQEARRGRGRARSRAASGVISASRAASPRV